MCSACVASVPILIKFQLKQLPQCNYFEAILIVLMIKKKPNLFIIEANVLKM